MEIGTVAFGKLDSHKSADDEEEKDEEIDEEAFSFGVLGHTTIIY